MYEPAEDLYAGVALNILDSLTLVPAGLADRSSQRAFGETHPLHWKCEFRKMRSLLWVWPSESQQYTGCGFAFALCLLLRAGEISWRLDLLGALLLLFLSFYFLKGILSLLVGDINHLAANSFFVLLWGSLVSFSVLLCPVLPQSLLLSNPLVIYLGVFGLESITQVKPSGCDINVVGLIWSCNFVKKCIDGGRKSGYA